MSERASRWLFLAELLLLALPSLGFLAAWALALIAGASFGAVAFLFHLPSGTSEAPGAGWALLQMGGFLIGGIAVALLGLFAIGRFLTVAFHFWKQGREGLGALRPLFLQGLLFAAIPFVVMLRIGWIMAGNGEGLDRLFALYPSGVTILPAILHLWLELRRAPVAATA